VGEPTGETENTFAWTLLFARPPHRLLHASLARFWSPRGIWLLAMMIRLLSKNRYQAFGQTFRTYREMPNIIQGHKFRVKIRVLSTV
jgi:hypothetical protein